MDKQEIEMIKGLLSYFTQSEENQKPTAYALASHVPALLDEVERLGNKSEEWRTAFIEMKKQWKHDCELLVQLDRQNETLKNDLDEVKAEHDAAVEDLKETSSNTCGLCKNNGHEYCYKWDCNGECENFVWRGVKAKEDIDHAK